MLWYPGIIFNLDIWLIRLSSIWTSVYYLFKSLAIFFYRVIFSPLPPLIMIDIHTHTYTNPVLILFAVNIFSQCAAYLFYSLYAICWEHKGLIFMWSNLSVFFFMGIAYCVLFMKSFSAPSHTFIYYVLEALLFCLLHLLYSLPRIDFYVLCKIDV